MMYFTVPFRSRPFFGSKSVEGGKNLRRRQLSVVAKLIAQGTKENNV